MARPARSSDWSASVEAVVKGAPEIALRPEALRAQVRLLALLGSAAPVDVLLAGLATYVETWSEGLYCSVLLVDPGGRSLRPGAAPSLPAAYVQAIDPVPIVDGVGSCGTAAARRELVIVEDVERSELWTGFAALAVKHGLRACWSVPILDHAKGLLGTLAMYYPVPRGPSAQEVDLIQFAASLAGLVIQRHRDAERLRRSEELLDAAIWGTEMGLWEWCLDGGGFKWFDRWCERFDIDPCLGPDAFDQWCGRVHPDDLESYKSVGEVCLNSRVDCYSVEYRIRTRSGRWRWLHERGRVMARTNDGVPTRYVGVCLDFDRQMTTEADLRRAEDRYEMAINAARVPVWEYDVTSGAVRGNVYWHRVAGYDLTEEQASERTETWLSDVHPDDAPRLQRVVEEPSSGTHEFYEIEFRMRQPNGQYRWLLDRGRVVQRSASGAPLRVVGVSIDIDARKRMESSLRESEERFRSAFEFAAVGMALVDLDGRWLRVNQALCRIVGYSAEELLRIDFQAITHPDDLDADRARLCKMLEGKLSCCQTEKRYLHKTGRVIWALRSVSLVRDDEGRPLYFISQIQDIGARKQAEERLRESEERFRSAFEFAAVGMALVNLDGRWLRVNQALCRIVGYSAEELLRIDFQSITHPDDLEADRAALRNMLDGTLQYHEREKRYFHKTGKTVWIRLSTSLIRDDGGRPQYFISQIQDITARKQAEERLRESEERFRSAFEFAAIGMALVAPDGRWLRVNQALCRIVGYSAEELLRIDFQAITHPDDLDADLACVRDMLEGTLSYYEMEKRYLHRDGQTIWILLSVSVVHDDEGRLQYFISQIQDITARKQAEERLRVSELRYRTTSDLVPGFVFEGVVLDGVPRTKWVSDGFERVYGCPLSEFTRLGLGHFYDAETLARLRESSAVLGRGQELRTDVQLRSLDGTEKSLRLMARAISAEGGSARVFGLAEDITEQNRLARALREATQQEQRRLGQEIHDGLGQELTGLAYFAGSLARAAANLGTAQATDLATLERIANHAVSSCRDIARGISPLTGSRGSLVQALRGLAESVATGGRMSISFEAIENAPITLPWTHRDQLYRIAQEAVANALRHSGGDRIKVRIEVDPRLVRMLIVDNGLGFDPQRVASEGFGIDSMLQRAAAAGARLRLGNPEGGGTTVVCECPQGPAEGSSRG